MPTRKAVFSGKGVAAAFLGGAAAGLFAGRILPPVVAMAAGSARTAAGRDPLEALIADHRSFSTLLRRMEESSDGQVAHRMQLLLRLKRGLAAHAMAEEDVVYPLLHDEARAEQEAKHLYGDHADIKLILHRLEAIPKDNRRWAEQVRMLRALIEEHAAREEQVEFPKLREALNGDGMARLSRSIGREKALVL